MPTPSWTVSFTTPTASNSPAKACAGHAANRTRRLDQPPSPVTQIHRPARLATRAASFRYGGRHHSGIPGDIIPLYPGDFVGIRNRHVKEFRQHGGPLVRVIGDRRTRGGEPAGQSFTFAEIEYAASPSRRIAGPGWAFFEHAGLPD